MSNPNIVNVTVINGNSSQVSLANTSANQLVSNAAASSKVFKINSIVVSNTNGTAAANITISTYSAATLGGTAYPIASTISVPANSTLIVTDKSTTFYLLENQSIGATAGTANYLTVQTSWEEIS
jgi:hypothetical protein